MEISLKPSAREKSVQILKMLTKYCDESLNELALTFFEFNDAVIQRMQPMLSRLQVLKLDCCTFADATATSTTTMLSFCSELHTLSIAVIHDFDFDATIAFPKLRSICLKGVTVSMRSMESFLCSHPLLREIIFESCIQSEIIESIANFNPELEKFELKDARWTENFSRNAEHLKRLTSLKSLELDCEGKSMTSLLRKLAAARIPLECLRLDCFNVDQGFFNSIVEWKQLRILELHTFLDWKLSDVLTIVSNLTELIELDLRVSAIWMTDLVEIVRCAAKLQKLVYWIKRDAIMCDTLVDVGSFMHLRDVVAKRTEKRRLVLLLDGSDFIHKIFKVNVPEELQRANAALLEIYLKPFIM